MGELMEKWQRAIDIGSGVRIEYFSKQNTHPDLKAGIFVMHMHEGVEDVEHLCIGSVNFDIPENNRLRDEFKRPVWQVKSWEPLTISPSVHNIECGLHGYIRDGRWVQA